LGRRWGKPAPGTFDIEEEAGGSQYTNFVDVYSEVIF
jgi:hypothetical protein